MKNFSLLIVLAGTLAFGSQALANPCAGIDWESGTAKAYKIDEIFGLTFGTAEGSAWGEIYGTITCLIDGEVAGTPTEVIDIASAKDKLGPVGFDICKDFLYQAYTSGGKKTFYIDNGKGESTVGCSVVNSDETSISTFERFRYPKH